MTEKRRNGKAILDMNQLDRLVGAGEKTVSDKSRPPVTDRIPSKLCEYRATLDFDERVDRCLSLIIHHEEVQMMAEIAKETYHELKEAGNGTD